MFQEENSIVLVNFKDSYLVSFEKPGDTDSKGFSEPQCKT